MSTRKKISQREAMRMRKRLKALEDYATNTVSTWPSGTNIHRVSPSDITRVHIQTAQALGYAVLAKLCDNGDLRYVATKP